MYFKQVKKSDNNWSDNEKRDRYNYAKRADSSARVFVINHS